MCMRMWDLLSRNGVLVKFPVYADCLLNIPDNE